VNRGEKAALVETLKGVLSEASVVVVTHYSGLNVAEMSDLRRRIGEAGGSFRVTKNRIAKLALAGTPYDSIAALFEGPTAIATSSDPIAAPKVAVAFAKDNDKLVILGGAMGETVLDQAGVKALAELPSLDELRGKIVGLLQAPATKVAQVLSAPGGQLARVINAYASKEPEAAE
jgi:large subunit ribosomal protein L10